jgi:hypothetical protein
MQRVAGKAHRASLRLFVLRATRVSLRALHGPAQAVPQRARPVAPKLHGEGHPFGALDGIAGLRGQLPRVCLGVYSQYAKAPDYRSDGPRWIAMYTTGCHSSRST